MRYPTMLTIAAVSAVMFCGVGEVAAQWKIGDRLRGIGCQECSPKGKPQKVYDVHVHQYLMPEKKSHLFSGTACPHRAVFLESAAIQRVPSPIRRTDLRFELEAGEFRENAPRLEAAPLSCEQELKVCRNQLNEQKEMLEKMMAEIAKLRALHDAKNPPTAEN